MTTDDPAYPADEWPKELPADLSMAARIEDTDLGTPLHEASRSGEGRIRHTTKRPPMAVGEGAGEWWQVTQQTGAYEMWWVVLPDGHVVTADRALAGRIANLPNLERDNAALRGEVESWQKAFVEFRRGVRSALYAYYPNNPASEVKELLSVIKEMALKLEAESPHRAYWREQAKARATALSEPAPHWSDRCARSDCGLTRNSQLHVKRERMAGYHEFVESDALIPHTPSEGEKDGSAK